MDCRIICCYSLLVFVLCFHQAKGQQWELGGSVGATGYMGDLNPSNVLYYRHVGAGLHAKYNMNGTWGIRAGANYLRLHGADAHAGNAYQRERNLSFDNNVVEFAALIDFNFFRFLPGFSKTRFTPYFFAGVAVAHHEPTITLEGQRYRVSELMVDQQEYINAENRIVRRLHQPWIMSLPFGAGAKYHVRGPWTVGAEVNYRTAFTNKLDNVSGIYANLAFQDLPPPVREHVDEQTWTYLADPSGQLLANAGTARGAGGRYDGYMTATVTLTYSIFSTRCYWW